MSLSSILGAVAGTVQYAADAVESAERAMVDAAVPLLHSAREATAPILATGLELVADHPQLFGDEVSDTAGLLAEMARSPSDNPLLLPAPLGDVLRTAVSQR